MPVCPKCRIDRWKFNFGDDGICLHCHEAERMSLIRDAAAAREQAAAAERDELTARLASIVLTTESASNLPIAERLDIVTAEVVIGMHLFKDIAAAWSDAFGGRSKTMQDGLRQARKTALDELRREALALGADAVVAVDLDYSEISGGGKSMLFLVASGTAVRLSA